MKIKKKHIWNVTKGILVGWALLTLLPPFFIEIINTAVLTKFITFAGPHIVVGGLGFSLYALIIQYALAVLILLLFARKYIVRAYKWVKRHV